MLEKSSAWESDDSPSVILTYLNLDIRYLGTRSLEREYTRLGTQLPSGDITRLTVSR